jgi:hypothetical protein
MSHTKTLGRLLILWSIAAAPAALARDKTDVIVLLNGDRITGEIKQLEYGLLQLSTDNMGTISIEWSAIGSIDSDFTFDVERTGGGRYSGAIATSEDSQYLVVRSGETEESVPLVAVTRVNELETRFWQRVSGNFSVGYNYTKSSGIETGNFNLSSQYQGPRVKSTLDVSIAETSSPDTEPTARQQFSSTVQFLSERPAFWMLLNSVESNDELGIDRRLQSGGAIARYFRQQQDSEVLLLSGVVANKEFTTGVDEETSNLEGVLGAQWRIFRFDDPEVSLTATAYLYPSITDSGRHRGNLDVSLKREIIKDLFFELSLYESYDSDPPSDGGTTTTDYGIVTSLGYKF